MGKLEEVVPLDGRGTVITVNGVLTFNEGDQKLIPPFLVLNKALYLNPDLNLDLNSRG